MPQTQADLEKLRAWLSSYPHWEDVLQVDDCEGRPGNTGLFPVALEETSRQADVLGNSLVGCRYRFTLVWQMAGLGNDGENACRLLDFQNWVQAQSACGQSPRFGDAPDLERIWTEKGGYTLGGQVVTYTITLIADFAKIYDVM